MSGFDSFMDKYGDRVRDAAKAKRWTGSGSSFEYDIMLLPDGVERPAGIPDDEIDDWDESAYFSALQVVEQEIRDRHRSGTAPDTSLWLGDERRAWLKERGGIQPTICAMVDRAMKRNP